MPQEQVEGADATQEATPVRAARIVVPIVIFVLVLLLLCSFSYTADLRVGITQRAVFVADNAECLTCHAEVLVAAAKRSVHQPFVTHHCDSCHNPHAATVQVSVTSQVDSMSLTPATWVRWGPFRWWVSWFERTVLGASEKSQRLERHKAVGRATLVATPRTLCWTCHGNLQAQAKMGFPHQPFAAANCLSCHDPHASNYEPLLNVAPKVLCVTCHPIGAELARDYAHPPVERLQCMDCHEAHASEYGGLLVTNQRDLCFTCHADVAGQATQAMQHQPFEGDNCTGCHEPHASDYQPLLNSETPTLCYRCHTSIEGRFDRVSHHPVGTRIECESCHDPHASDNSALLVLSERSLCLSCHTDIAAMADLSVQHSPFQNKPCTSCHTPHGSKYDPLLRNPQPSLCYHCHPEKATAMSRVSHHPEDCTRCHGVHASENESLLFAENDNSLCYRCHPTIALTYLGSSHRGVACLSCHNPHGSRFGSLRRHGPTTLCLGCHPGDPGGARFRGHNTHPATPNFYDAVSKEPLTCTSTCHDPHGTPYAYMMRSMEWYYDGTCLPCHKSVGKRF